MGACHWLKCWQKVHMEKRCACCCCDCCGHCAALVQSCKAGAAVVRACSCPCTVRWCRPYEREVDCLLVCVCVCVRRCSDVFACGLWVWLASSCGVCVYVCVSLGVTVSVDRRAEQETTCVPPFTPYIHTRAPDMCVPQPLQDTGSPRHVHTLWQMGFQSPVYIQ